jgi:hypothetical protein
MGLFHANDKVFGNGIAAFYVGSGQRTSYYLLLCGRYNHDRDLENLDRIVVFVG